MKERELRDAARCALCRELFGHVGIPLFWRVTVERWGVDARALQRQEGLTMLLGGRADIAAVMGPDEDMAKRLYAVTLTVCESCAIERNMLSIAALAEIEGATERGRENGQ